MAGLNELMVDICMFTEYWGWLICFGGKFEEI